MHEEGPVPGIISLTVARRRYEDPDQFQGSSSSAATSLNSNGGGNSSSNNNSGTFQQLQQQVQQVQQVGFYLKTFVTRMFSMQIEAKQK